MSDSVHQLFLEEAQELLQVMEAELLELRTQPDIAALMRAAHTLKGSGAMIGLTAIPAIAHRLEDVFSWLIRQPNQVDDSLETLLLQAYDHLERSIVEDLQGGRHDEALVMTQAEPVLVALDEWLTATAQPAATETKTVARDSDPSDETATWVESTDLVITLFEGDVAAGLETLSAALEEESGTQLKVLRSQLDAFVGIGELTSLPGFTAIAQAGLTALDCRPTQSAAIGRCVLTDLQAAQTAVLAGDRQQGGQPSETLLSFGTAQDSIPTAQVLPPTAASSASPWDDSAEDAMLLALFGEDEGEDENETVPGGEPEETTDDFAIVEQSDVAEDNLDIGLAELDLELSAAAPSEMATEGTDMASFETDAVEIPTTSPIDALTEDQAAPMPEPTEPANAPAPPQAKPPAHGDKIAVSGLNRPITSGLPKTLIAKLEALLDSAPPEAVIHRQSSKPRTTELSAAISEPKKAPTSRSKTVRVGLDRIKRLSTLFGELVTYENKSALQAQQLQYVISSMTQRFRNFERITRSLQDWADQSQQDRSRLMASAAEGFDSLQMDSYDDVHLLMQEVMEEIAQLGETIHDMTAITHQGHHVHRQKQQTLRQLRNDLIRTSMMPMGDLLRHFPRMVRDMSAKYGKQVKMTVQGGDTLVDRTVFEKLYDPLVHLVRNAFDHGIEPARTRAKRNKPVEATISLRAYSKSHQTYLEISDDGRGISLDSVRKKAIERGLYTTEEAAQLSTEQLYDCLFNPGFSTAAAVSELSGRGVGLDVVATQLKQLKGSIKVVSVPNGGTTFVLRFPLSLNVAELMVFSVGNRTFAIAMDAVKTILSVATEDITIGDETPFYQWQGQPVELYPRSTLLNHYPLRGSRSRDSLPAIPLPKDGKVPLIIIAAGNRMLALQVDSILQAQELTIKPFSIAIQPPNYLLGCTTLGNGSLIPVMDGQALLARYFEPHSQSRVSQPTKLKLPRIDKPTAAAAPTSLPEPPAASPPLAVTTPQTVLVVDDSLTARQVLIFTLEKAGYQTLQAKDGRDAIDQLSQNFAEICAVFCDVEMPRMNGFEFLSQCQQDHGKKAPPVIMLTSRSGDKHREMGESLGASAYLTKPYLEQALLNTLQECLEARTQ